MDRVFPPLRISPLEILANHISRGGVQVSGFRNHVRMSLLPHVHIWGLFRFSFEPILTLRVMKVYLPARSLLVSSSPAKTLSVHFVTCLHWRLGILGRWVSITLYSIRMCKAYVYVQTLVLVQLLPLDYWWLVIGHWCWYCYMYMYHASTITPLLTYGFFL